MPDQNQNPAVTDGDPFQNKETGTERPGSQAAFPGSEIHEPNACTKPCKTNETDKHWLDYATGFFAFVAAIGAIAAAIFTGWQAWVASDAKMRQLRAYLIVGHGPLVMTDTNASVKIKIMHGGVTPAYKRPIQQ